jgi:ferrous iron transport protein B
VTLSALKSSAKTHCHRRLIAIAGNPNAGKTTVFNALTGARQKIANYPGVTVERKIGLLHLPSGEEVDVVDLPGCYSLAARSPEEQIAHDVIMGESDDDRKLDGVIVVVDASNLQRNLFLVSQLQDRSLPLVVALNMMDIARERGSDVSAEKLETALGCRVVPLVARKGEGIGDLLSALDEVPCACCATGQTPRFIDCLPKAIEEPVQMLAGGLAASGLCDAETARGESLWLLVSSVDGDGAKISPAKVALAARVMKESRLSSQQIRAIETTARYGYLKELMRGAAIAEQDLPHRLTNRLDRIFLHKVFGPPIFLVLMALVFQTIFSWASPAMNGIQSAVGAFAGLLGHLIPNGLFKDLVLHGALAGVGNVLVFLPQILALFLFIGLLEDVGYMARAAFIMDRIMARVGLDGRAFLPLLSSFACAIPGIMATRTIANRKDRLVTILVAPLMSCSARLPVYTLIIATVFSTLPLAFGFLSVGGLVLLALYLLSVIVGVAMAALFKRTLLRSPKPPLLLELPTYKLPSLKTLGLNLLDRGKLFVIRAGTVILAVTVILWALLHIPVGKTDFSSYERAASQIEANWSLTSAAKADASRTVSAQREAYVIEHSVGGRVGKALEPVIKPLGFNWQIGIGILASFAAREVFVSALAVVHGLGDADEHSPSLRNTLRGERDPATGALVYTPLMGLALLVFFVLACQCMSTVAIVRRETQSWRWPAFMIAYMSVLAWLGAFVVYQGGKLVGLG